MIVIFNGPPGSGKDEAAGWFKRRGFAHLSFKHYLFRETIAEFGVDTIWFMDGYNNRDIKETPETELRGMSRREAMIHTSEDVIKPKYGKSYFGQKVASQVDIDEEYVISDGGFIEELEPLIEKIGVENIILVQLVREGCSYSTDSRRYFNGYVVEEIVNGYKSEFESNYLLNTELPIETYRIYNNGTICGFHYSLEKIYDIIIGKEQYASNT
jgi:hypothetical protein